MALAAAILKTPQKNKIKEKKGEGERTGSLYLLMAILELTSQTRVVLNSSDVPTSATQIMPRLKVCATNSSSDS